MPLMKFFLSSLIVIFCAFGFPTKAETLSGKPRVIDGDTLEIAGQRIGLYGIDAPEMNQVCTKNGKPWACGEKATMVLLFAAGTHWVDCVTRETDTQGRLMADCKTGPYHLSEFMVRTGWALADRHVTDQFVAKENEARKTKKGLWKGSFVEPWEWRNAQ